MDFSRVQSPTDKLLLVGFCQLQALDPESVMGLPEPNTVLALESLPGFYPARGPPSSPPGTALARTSTLGTDTARTALLDMPAHTKSLQSAELFPAKISHSFIRAPNKTMSEWKAQNPVAFPVLYPGLWRKQGGVNREVLFLSTPLSPGAFSSQGPVLGPVSDPAPGV